MSAFSLAPLGGEGWGEGLAIAAHQDFAASPDSALSNSSTVGAPVNLAPLMKNVGVELTSSSFDAIRRPSTILFSRVVFLRQLSNSSLLMPPSLTNRARASR